MTAYPLRQSVAFWHIGDHLGRQREIKSRARRAGAISRVAGGHPGPGRRRLAPGDGDRRGRASSLPRAPSGLDMIGIQPRMWARAQSLLETYQYLTQRKLLTVRSNLGGLFWAWIPATTPPEVIRNIWGDDTPPRGERRRFSPSSCAS